MRAATPAEVIGSHAIAPWPNVDRYPTVIGSSLTTAYISAVFKACTFGYRREYVDVLSELIERDPHAYAALAQRILTISGARLEFTAPPETAGTASEELAKTIAEDVSRRVDDIPHLHSALADLQWAIFYGPTGSEIMWEPTNGWTPVELTAIHSRRISYPDQDNWEAHIWDQGAVGSLTGFGTYPSESMFGFPISRYPNKFVLHVPRVRGDYPTRDGIGREIAFYLALKGMALRGGGQYIERFAKPWVIGKYSTSGKGAPPRAANDPDIAVLKAVCAAVAAGTLSSGVLPDSTDALVQSPALNAASGKIQHVEFIDFLDRQVSVAALGQSDTLDGGKNGSRASTETRKEGTAELLRYDAMSLGQTLRYGLARAIVSLNYPGHEKLTPICTVHVQEKPDPVARAQVIRELVTVGMPIDAVKVAAEMGLPLVDPKDPKAIQLVLMSPMATGAKPEETKQPADDARDGNGTGPTDQQDTKANAPTSED